LTLGEADPILEGAGRKFPAATTDTSSVKPSSDVIARQLGDSAVLIRMRTSRIYELNATGARIWELLSQGASRESAVEALLAEFHIERPEAEVAVDELVGSLRSEGLL